MPCTKPTSTVRWDNPLGQPIERTTPISSHYHHEDSARVAPNVSCPTTSQSLHPTYVSAYFISTSFSYRQQRASFGVATIDASQSFCAVRDLTCLYQSMSLGFQCHSTPRVSVCAVSIHYTTPAVFLSSATLPLIQLSSTQITPVIVLLFHSPVSVLHLSPAINCDLLLTSTNWCR
jgi:hypothetical protein